MKFPRYKIIKPKKNLNNIIIFHNTIIISLIRLLHDIKLISEKMIFIHLFFDLIKHKEYFFQIFIHLNKLISLLNLFCIFL
jgi:hypothetical protein